MFLQKSALEMINEEGSTSSMLVWPLRMHIIQFGKKKCAQLFSDNNNVTRYLQFNMHLLYQYTDERHVCMQPDIGKRALTTTLKLFSTR